MASYMQMIGMTSETNFPMSSIQFEYIMNKIICTTMLTYWTQICKETLKAFDVRVFFIISYLEFGLLYEN